LRHCCISSFLSFVFHSEYWYAERCLVCKVERPSFCFLISKLSQKTVSDLFLLCARIPWICSPPAHTAMPQAGSKPVIQVFQRPKMVTCLPFYSTTSLLLVSMVFIFSLPLFKDTSSTA
jgi:hypothetical protein